jgi:hypothetical protein
MNERGHFLNEQQKELKSVITHMLIMTISSLMEGGIENKVINNEQEEIDLLGSVLIMFNREIISHYILNRPEIDAASFMDGFCMSLKEAIKTKIDNESKNKH